MKQRINQFENILEFMLLTATVVVTFFWFIGKPLFYSISQPVMSIFTAISLFMMIGNRLATKHLFGWPMPLTIAIPGLVLGGNLSSLMMQMSVPPSMLRSFDLVITSSLTSLGLILFCSYEIVTVLRKTPQKNFIIDDILIHLALVPGGLSLLGHLLHNPTYMSAGADPRVGISIMEMGFMAAYAITAVLSNNTLFLWKFLSTNWTNRFIFLALFANQFIAPVIVAYVFGTSGQQVGQVGVELFVMLAGVITTLLFLTIQSYSQEGVNKK